MILALVYLIKNKDEKGKKDLFLLISFIISVYFSIYCIFGVPEWLSRITLMSITIGSRAAVPLATLNIYMLIYIMSKVIILQGCPASGKSTWAREFVKGKKDWVIVNRDSIREGRGDYWIPEQEKFISELEVFHIRKALEYGLNVIIDATNLNPTTLAKWDTIAKEFSAEVEIKSFDIPLDEAIRRDSERSRSVGEKVIRDFYNRYKL
jgi:predicted kinase